MINKFTPTTSAAQPSGECWAGTDHLDSWKEIASYLRREIRTVQLWEKNEGLPVHRHYHKQMGSVYALRSELERWKFQVSRKKADQGAEPGAASGKAETRISICVPHLASETANSERRHLNDTITAMTIAALERLNPGHLQIVGSQELLPGEAGTSTVQSLDPEATRYRLQWDIQDDSNGMRLDASLLLDDTRVAVWSHSYHGRANEIGELPGCVAEEIARCLWLKVFSSPVRSPAVTRCEDAGARAAYLRGRFFWNQRNEEGLRKALECFESAIAADPRFALSYSGLADSLTLLSFYEIVSPSEAMPSARRAALKAIELDPNLAEAHASLADVFLHFDRDWQAADREYRRSIECNPDYALGYHWYANLLTAKGQHEAAHIAIMHALDLDPVSIITLVWAGVTSHLAHRFEEAVKHYRSALELDPHFIWAHMYLAQALEQQGNLKGALREFETTLKLSGGSSCVKAMKAHAHAMAGDRSSARGILSELKRVHSRKNMPSYDIAATYTALGESDRAVAWLNRACDERNMKLFTLTQDPRFDSLRQGPAFQEIVAQIGLQQGGPTRSSSHSSALQQ